jgi:hypothetical protein
MTNNIAEFERMLYNKNNRLNRKAELTAEIQMINSTLVSIENMITIYSAIDSVRLKQLEVVKRELEILFIDVLSESNDLWLESIKSA